MLYLSQVSVLIFFLFILLCHGQYNCCSEKEIADSIEASVRKNGCCRKDKKDYQTVYININERNYSMAQFNGSTRVADLLRSQFDVQEPVTVNKLVNVRVTTKDTIPAAGIVSCVESHVNPWTNHVYVPSTLRFGSSDSEMQKKSSQRPKSAKPLSVSNLWNVEGEIKTRPLRKIVK